VASGCQCRRGSSANAGPALRQVVFDAETDLPDGEGEPGADDAKTRISYFVRRVVPGKEDENILKLVNAAYAQANTAKHRHTATPTTPITSPRMPLIVAVITDL
jgi:hypothetical protein